MQEFSDFFPNKKKSKYKNKRTLYNGIWYDSQSEASYAKTLDDLSMLHVDDPRRPSSVARQVPYPIHQNGELMFTYYADFVVTYVDKTDVIDVKGVETDVYKIKKKFVENFYNIKIKEIDCYGEPKIKHGSKRPRTRRKKESFRS